MPHDSPARRDGEERSKFEHGREQSTAATCVHITNDARRDMEQRHRVILGLEYVFARVDTVPTFHLKRFVYPLVI